MHDLVRAMQVEMAELKVLLTVQDQVRTLVTAKVKTLEHLLGALQVQGGG